MPLAKRAKIFIPFDPLKGYQEALREKERQAEARMDDRVQVAGPRKLAGEYRAWLQDLAART